MSGLADYLAKNYLTADSEKKSKKRKRKNRDAGLVIQDDDSLGWQDKAGDDDDDAPMIGEDVQPGSLTLPMDLVNLALSVGGGTFNKSKHKSKRSSAATWTAVGVAAPSHAAQLAADAAAAADAIIADTAADRKKAAEAEDEAPEMVDQDGVLETAPGAKAGLQTAAQVEAAMKKKQAEEKRQADKSLKELGGGAAQETIYRDASGRIINVAMKRAEARKKAEEEERQKRDKERAARGDVQNAQAERWKQQLQDAKTMTVARYADDAELNDELKERDHWNDPALGFLRKKKAGRSVTGKPLYKGPFQPNRYNIRPGHRWDGIDRSNGFEKQWFDSRNRKANIEKLEYQWQMDE